MSKRLCVISDLQCGSIFGMLPPDFITAEGVPKLQNAGQRYLWECWEDFTGRAAKYKPSIVIVNGDLIDGKQRKSEGVELSLPIMHDQVRAATQCLKYLKAELPPCRWFFVRGTAYHVGAAAEFEEAVAESLGGEHYWSVGSGTLVREVLWLDIDGVIVEASHHIGVTQGFHRLTALDSEMQWSAMTAKDESKGIPKADLIIRSHVHNFQHAEHASKHGVVTPCWQLQTTFMRKKSTYRMLPDLGGLLIEVDGAAKKRGESPVDIHKELYPLPAVKLTKA